MNWFVLSCVTALTQAVKDTFLKRSLNAMDAATGMLGYCLAASVCLWLAVAAGPPVSLRGGYWPLLLLGGVLGGVTYWLYGLALKAGDLSLTLPMLAFTPLFLLVTSPLTVGEFPEPGGLCGIALVVGGAYVLNLRERRYGLLGPIRALVTNAGSRLMLAVAVIWSIGANIDKLGLAESSPLFWGASVYTATALALAVGLVRKRPALPPRVVRVTWPLAVAGLLEAVGIVCQMYALPLTQVSYVIAVKRLSIVFGVLLGAAVFHEPDLRHRLPGALLMVVGVFFIAVFG
ncbi:MAG: DMT family transporter [Solidesulfovibrio sp.]|uniref:DMT family transporter n=1 Tax=Solidesulfovibrio sp. TaxID=2910990 RepID=UPI002B1F4C55|nr:DMT family transporter [Solidesulfovibrio sp.]MEA4857207.1 DMT family transporter [Solidesulfovibrio sp.]